MKHLIRAALFLATLSVNSYAQSDWNTYPVRPIADIIQTHSVEASKKVDLIVSADPFPSKTVVTYTGRHRPVGEYTNYFISLWVQTRNVPPENANMLVEEYLFREKDKEYWMPVHKLLAPHFEKELKEGDEVTIYYFFLGGYNEKKLREKKKDKTKEDTAGTIEDKVEWVFAVEEFQKPALKSQDESGGSVYISQPLTSAIDKNLEGSGRKQGFLIDARQVKSKSKVIYTGEVRKVGEKKLRFLQLWLESRGLPPNVIELLQQEMRVREGEKDYWLPVRKKILDDIAERVKKGDEIVIHTILAGGVSQADSIEWVFVVGDFSK
jgi:molybdopterin converting factor small subunit